MCLRAWLISEVDMARIQPLLSNVNRSTLQTAILRYRAELDEVLRTVIGGGPSYVDCH